MSAAAWEIADDVVSRESRSPRREYFFQPSSGTSYPDLYCHDIGAAERDRSVATKSVRVFRACFEGWQTALTELGHSQQYRPDDLYRLFVGRLWDAFPSDAASNSTATLIATLASEANEAPFRSRDITVRLPRKVISSFAFSGRFSELPKRKILVTSIGRSISEEDV